MKQERSFSDILIFAFYVPKITKKDLFIIEGLQPIKVLNISVFLCTGYQ